MAGETRTPQPVAVRPRPDLTLGPSLADRIKRPPQEQGNTDAQRIESFSLPAETALQSIDTQNDLLVSGLGQSLADRIKEGSIQIAGDGQTTPDQQTRPNEQQTPLTPTDLRREGDNIIRRMDSIIQQGLQPSEWDKTRLRDIQKALEKVAQQGTSINDGYDDTMDSSGITDQGLKRLQSYERKVNMGEEKPVPIPVATKPDVLGTLQRMRDKTFSGNEPLPPEYPSSLRRSPLEQSVTPDTGMPPVDQLSPVEPTSMPALPTQPTPLNTDELLQQMSGATPPVSPVETPDIIAQRIDEVTSPVQSAASSEPETPAVASTPPSLSEPNPAEFFARASAQLDEMRREPLPTPPNWMRQPAAESPVAAPAEQTAATTPRERTWGNPVRDLGKSVIGFVKEVRGQRPASLATQSPTNPVVTAEPDVAPVVEATPPPPSYESLLPPNISLTSPLGHTYTEGLKSIVASGKGEFLSNTDHGNWITESLQRLGYTPETNTFQRNGNTYTEIAGLTKTPPPQTSA